MNKATKWGCDHKSTATEAYILHMKKEHTNFEYEEAIQAIFYHSNHIFFTIVCLSGIGFYCTY